MINKENSNQVKILVVLGVIQFAGLADWPKKIYLLWVKATTIEEMLDGKEKASFMRSWLST